MRVFRPRQPPVTLTRDEIAARLPLWQALSDLFLDTELQALDFEHMARTVLASGLAPPAVAHVLWREVFPALADNLRCVAGEWAGFDDDFLKERIMGVLSGAQSPSEFGLISLSSVRSIVAEAWLGTCKHLPEAYRSVADPVEQDGFSV